MNKKSHAPIIAGGVFVALVVAACSIFFLSKARELEPIVEPEESTAEELTGPPYNFDYSWSSHPYIAHAMGGILGDTYTNSYEAFLLNYQMGQRVFEVDFFLTTDAETVAAHDDANWRNRTTATADDEFSHANVRSYLIDDKYHALDCRQVIELMRQYPDIYIVTDTKFTDRTNSDRQFTQIVELAKEIDTSVLNRFVIQIYHQEMLDWVMAIHPWKSVIYTLYADPTWTPENVLAFSKASGVKFITMWDSWVTPEIADLWTPSGIKIAAHTVNDFAAAEQLRATGIDVIYTDFLIP